jgi:flagellar hook-associated protein 1 FlgK
VDFDISGSAAAGDNFVVRPTVNAASGFKLALTDRSQIAAAAPVATAATTSNKGTVSVSPGSVDSTYLASPLTAPVTFTYDAASGKLKAAPATQAVTVTSGGTATTYPAGTDIPYTSDATYSFGGITLTMSGVPQDGDSYTVAKNSGVGDVRNVGLMADLQGQNIFSNGNATIQTAYAGLVSLVGNKAREVQINGEAGDALLSQVKNSAQDVSGVNLDEEATNLLRYQQAYQASGKIMQIASTVFDTLLSIGH